MTTKQIAGWAMLWSPTAAMFVYDVASHGIGRALEGAALLAAALVVFLPLFLFALWLICSDDLAKAAANNAPDAASTADARQTAQQPRQSVQTSEAGEDRT